MESLLLTVLVLVMALWLLPSIWSSLSNPFEAMGNAVEQATR